jgi:2,4-dienoyl-CoA reductase-like NADH-dependent reductase (Old Yellow Enzyme family)
MLAYSGAIDSADTRQDAAMTTAPIARRFNAFAAAVTLAMLAGIDTLAGHEAPLQMAATAATQVAG